MLMSNNVEVQKLAEELVFLDVFNDAARVLKIQSQIWLAMYSQIKVTEKMHKGSEVISFPLLGSSEIWTYDLWLQVLNEVCGYNKKKNCWRYKTILSNGKKAASFITMFKNTMKWRIKNPTLDIDDFDDYLSADEENTVTIGDKYAHKKYIKEQEDVAQKERASDRFIAITSFLSKTQKIALHQGKKAQDKQMYFEAFFTYDITKASKTKITDEYGKKTFALKKADVKKYNDILFCVMQIILLQYLMYGEFTQMTDIFDNTLKFEKWLTRQQSVEECYEVTRQTVSKYEETYEDFINAIVY